MSTATFNKTVSSLVTTEIVLTLIEIYHPNWASTLYLVNNTEPIISQGIEYTPTGFKVSLPTATEDDAIIAQVTIDDIDKVITANFRSVISPPDVTVRVILASAPDIVEAGPHKYSASKFMVNATTVNIELTHPTIFGNNLTGFNISSNYFPGLFL